MCKEKKGKINVKYLFQIYIRIALLINNFKPNKNLKILIKYNFYFREFATKHNL